MRVALVHDYIKEYGGAERVLEALHELYPNAPVFTTVYLPEFLGPHKGRFRNWDIRTSMLQKLPYKQKLISPFRIISPFVFKQFDFSQYDIIIVSATGAYFPNTIRVKRDPSTSLRASTESKKKKNPVLVCYCHTPPRYLYGYKTARDWQKNIITKIIGIVGNHFFRMVDYNASKNVDYYIANSQEVAGRIKKFYRREAKVIYPPVNISSKFKVESSKLKKEYYLAGGRLARPKHIDLIVRACAELNVALKVFGKGFAGYDSELRSLVSGHQSLAIGNTEKTTKGANDQRLRSNVQFVGEVTDGEKWKLMQEAKAFLFASEDEDFGIIPVEAMAAGTPVIAYRSGGVKETVIDGKTGLFFDTLTIEDFTKAIKQFNQMTIDPNDCMKQAEKFSEERFIKAMKYFIEQKTS